MKNYWSLREMWETTKYTNICRMGIAEVEKKKKREKYSKT